MEFRTYTIPPGGAEEIALQGTTPVQVLMTDAVDVVWLMLEKGALDVDRAIRLDKLQCPFGLVVKSFVIHSPAQGGRTVQVSLLIGGIA